ncbi:MAG: PIN domain-containing protein [Chloroflexota bacterium]
MTPRFLIDTSCMVAVLCAWHEHHERATRAIEQRLDEGQTLVVAAPGLIEAYAVLTRLPPPHRLSPSNSGALLTANFMNDGVEVAALGIDRYARLLGGAARRGIAGGAIYDAVIVACALAAGIDALLTFNQRQFHLLAAREVDIVVP